jgi:cell division septation protein DedD
VVAVPLLKTVLQRFGHEEPKKLKKPVDGLQKPAILSSTARDNTMAKINKTERKMREIMNQGAEPDWKSLNHQAVNFAGSYMMALNWIHRTVEADQLRSELAQWLVAQRKEVNTDTLATLSDPVLMTMGKIAYCLNRGAQLSDKSVGYIIRSLNQIAPAVQLAPEPDGFEDGVMTAAGRLNEDYVNVYSRLDNIRARVNAGRMELGDVKNAVQEIMERWGTRPGVSRRVIGHYTERLEEAQADSTIRAWVKPLRAILRALSNSKEEVAKPRKTNPAVVKPAAAKPAKQAKVQPQRKTKKAAAGTPKPLKVPQIKKANENAKPSFASQVRELIADARQRDMSQPDVINLAVSKLMMKPSSARNCVLANWDRV